MPSIACVGFNRINVKQIVQNIAAYDCYDFDLLVFSKGQNPFSKIDLILIEHDQKKIDSLICIKNIKRLNPSIPIILVLNEYNPFVALQAFRVRVWDVFFLPFETENFQDKIRELLSFRCISNLAHDRDVIFPVDQPYEKIVRHEVTTKTKLAIDFIEKNYMHTIRVKDLVDVCCLTPSQFSKYFKLEHGCTARDYIKNYRMCVAKVLLKQTVSSVDVIAYETGFKTVALFNRLFLKAVGHTPSEYRAVL